jgi:hypothetical protein
LASIYLSKQWYCYYYFHPILRKSRRILILIAPSWNDDRFKALPNVNTFYELPNEKQFRITKNLKLNEIHNFLLVTLLTKCLKIYFLKILSGLISHLLMSYELILFIRKEIQLYQIRPILMIDTLLGRLMSSLLC